MVDRVRFFSARNFSQSEEVGSSWARTITYDAARTTQRCVNGGGRGLALTQLCARGKERERERGEEEQGKGRGKGGRVFWGPEAVDVDRAERRAFSRSGWHGEKEGTGAGVAQTSLTERRRDGFP